MASDLLPRRGNTEYAYASLDKGGIKWDCAE